MSSRFVRTLLFAAVLGLGLCHQATAKPPDLPLNPHDSVTPPAPQEEAESPLLPVWPQVPAGSRLNDAGVLVPDSPPATPARARSLPLLDGLRPQVRRELASWMLFGVHPLLSLCPTEKVLDCPKDHPMPEAVPAEPTPEGDGGAAAALFAASCGTGLVFAEPLDFDQEDCCKEDCCKEDCCKDSKPEGCKCAGKCACNECCCKKKSCGKGCSCAKGCCGKDCCAKGCCGKNCCGSDCCGKGCCTVAPGTDIRCSISLGWFSMDLQMHRKPQDEECHGSLMFGLALPLPDSAGSVVSAGYMMARCLAACSDCPCGARKSEQKSAVAETQPQTCPWRAQQEARRRRVVPPAVLEEHTVLQNLQKLIDAREMLQKAEKLRDKGHLCDALDCYKQVCKQCPGSTAAEAAEAAIEQVQVQLKTSARRAQSAEEQEQTDRLRKARQAQRKKKVKPSAEQSAPDGAAEAPGARQQALWLMTAAQRALEAGEAEKAIDLIRQARAVTIGDGGSRAPAEYPGCECGQSGKRCGPDCKCQAGDGCCPACRCEAASSARPPARAGFGLTPPLPAVERKLVDGLERIGIDFEKNPPGGLIIVVEEESVPPVQLSGEEEEEGEEQEFIPWYDDYDQTPAASNGVVREVSPLRELLEWSCLEVATGPEGLRLHSHGSLGPVGWKLRRDRGVWDWSVEVQ
jgi:hypothetical protein